MRLPVALASALILFFAATILAGPVAASPVVAANAAPDDAALIRRAVELTNQERERAGLNPLEWNEQLAASATAYAQDMANRSFFAHNSPEGTTPIERARVTGYPAYGWGGLYVGENLARGYNSAESVHQGWMNSESHKQNLLHAKYREIGIGVAVAPNGTRYWAQEFGSRPGVLPVFLNAGAGTTESREVSVRLTDEQVSSWGSVADIAGMMISNRPDFADAVWEPFATSRSWMIPGLPGRSGSIRAAPRRQRARSRGAR